MTKIQIHRRSCFLITDTELLTLDILGTSEAKDKGSLFFLLQMYFYALYSIKCINSFV